MINKMKIRTRLTLQFIFICAGIFILALLFIFNQFRQYVENDFFAHLESKGRMTAEMMLRHESELKPIQPQNTDNTTQLPSIGNISIFNDQFQCVFTLNSSASLAKTSQIAQIDFNTPYRFSIDKFKAVGFTIMANSGKKYFVISEDIPDFSKLITLRNILLLSFMLIIAAVAAGGWFYAGQALQPVSHIVNEVDNIIPTDLSGRLKKDNNHDELSHLVTTFNSLLDRIEHAFQMQRSFISNVSHELKNPMATMDAQLQLVRNKPRTIQEYDRVLTSLHEDVKELTGTADKLLQLAKIHSGNTQIDCSNVRLDELIYQSRDAVLRAHPAYFIDIEFKALPENDEDLCVFVNEPLLRTALINLLDNSCKFSDDNKAIVVLDYDAKNQIEIKDKGQGISTEDMPYIFEPFFRGVQNGHKKGSGIGLSLVKSILQLHNITISVKSTAEEGTTFSLSFPKSGAFNEIYNTPSVLMPNSDKKNGEKASFAHLKKILKLFFFTSIIAISGFNCSKIEKSPPPQYQEAFDISQDWYKMLLDLVQYSVGYRPPVSARMYAYVGLAAWEAGLPALNDAQSIAPTFKDLKLPVWKSQQPFIAPIALNATYETLARDFFPHTTFEMQENIRKLSNKWYKSLSKHYPLEAILVSENYGKAIANAVFQWSAKDSVGHQAFLYNYHPNFKSPTHKGAWQPHNFNAMPALLPYWGAARTFITPINAISTVPPVPFSEENNSPFFTQAMEVYTTSKPMTEEKQQIAEFWSDDIPNISFCAASRWIAIAHQVLEIQKPDLSKTLETYLKLGLALNDVAVKVWHEKYYFSIIRPDTYIQKNIDADWKPLHETPPFPAYPSGHAAFGGAGTTVLSKMLNLNTPLTDRSHEHSKIFNGKPRTYNSFKEVAEENALSRLYMGVHYRMDCEEGLRIGNLIGEKTFQIMVKNSPGKIVEKGM
jgi:signal transduction histidine kinase